MLDVLSLVFLASICYFLAYIGGINTNRKDFYKKIRSGVPIAKAVENHQGAFSIIWFSVSIVFYFILTVVVCKIFPENLNFDLDTNVSLGIGVVIGILLGIIGWIALKKTDVVPPYQNKRGER